MFEHDLVVGKLRQALREKHMVMKKYVQVQNDIKSVIMMLRDQLWSKFEVPRELFTPVPGKEESDFLGMDPRAPTSGASGMVKASKAHDQKVQVDKSLYQNSSELPFVDKLAEEIQNLFSRISKYVNGDDNADACSEEELDFDSEIRDKV